MKRIIIMFGLAVLVLASCSKDKVNDIRKGSPIDFRAAVGTKATEFTTEDLQSFVATAIDGNNDLYFDGLTFTKTGSTFVSYPEYYWPSYGTLTFYAYSHHEFLKDISITSQSQSFSFDVESQVENQIDIVAVKAEGSNTSEGMALEFKHCLSQIQINAKNTNEGYVYTVSGAKIVNVYDKGVFDFDFSKVWTVKDDASLATYASTIVPIVLTEESQSLMGDAGNAMVIPQQLTAWDEDGPANAEEQIGSYLAISVNVKTSEGFKIYPKDADEYGWVAVGIDTQWLPGYRYVYTLDLSNGAGLDEDTAEPVLGDALRFDVNVRSWNGNGQWVLM